MTIAMQNVLTQPAFEALVDYRRAVSQMYAQVRKSTLSPAEGCRQFRQQRDELFQSHPQSALSERQKRSFSGLRYYPYNPDWRFVLPVDTDVEPKVLDLCVICLD